MNDSAVVSGGAVLIVDDEKNIRRTLRMVLEGEGYQVLDASGIAEAERILLGAVPGTAPGATQIDMVMLDITLGNDNGIDLLRSIKARPSGEGPEAPYDTETPVVIISGNASIDDAIQATRLGAFDFLEKPLDRNRVVVTVRNAIEHRHMLREVSKLRAAVDSRYEMLGESALMQELRRQICKLAPTKSRVLITGESGTGKELIARAIHRNSAVSNNTFVKVNCAAIPPELIESELFGHERGAFTGAVAKKRGLFEIAHRGTIFLDEIGDMSLSAQAKVLRVLQTGDITPVGGEQTFQVDCRVIAATNRDLETMVETGEFREDLYFRINVVPVRSPKLSERADDVPLLAESFMRECCDENGFGYKPMDQAVTAKLKQYEWPGNVRELRNVMERLVIMSDETITERDLPPSMGGPARTSGAHQLVSGAIDVSKYGERTLREFREDVETEFIRFKLAEYEWNISRTAQALGIERTNLHKKLRALGIRRSPKK